MRKFTTDLFIKLFLYSVLPFIIMNSIFGLIMKNYEYEKINNIAKKQIEMMNEELLDEVDFLSYRIPQRMNHTIHMYGKVQDDLKFFIYRVKEIYDIYLLDKNGIIIDGESKFYTIEKGVPLKIDNSKFQIENNDIFIKLEKELVNGQKVLYRVSIRKILNLFTLGIEEMDFFVTDKDGNLIYHSNPSIYIKRPNLKGLGFLESSAPQISGYYNFPTETETMKKTYLYILKDINDELVYGVSIKDDILKHLFGKLFLQIVLICAVYVSILYLIAKYLSNYISKPIIELTNYSIKATIDENTTLNTEKFPNNELKILADNIYNSFQTIRSLKDELLITIMSIGDGVIVTDESAKIVLMNPVAESITGYKSEEVKGKHINEVFKISNEMTGNPIENPLLLAIEEKKICGLANHTTLLDKNMDKKIISDSAAPIIINGKIKGGVLIFRDDTEKERFKQEMIRKQQIETICLVAGGIAHDFNNILSAINNYMLVAKMSFEDNPKIVEFANNVLNLCSAGKFLSNKLLVLSKGGEHISLVETDLYSLISETARFVLSGSSVKYHITKGKEYCFAMVDQNLIAQVFHNLILNSKQAMPEGGEIFIDISMDHSVLVNKKPSLKIVVQDTGKGIPKENLEKIFQPFFTTKKAGSGLGLYIVKSIIDKHEGKIYVESEEGKGAKFTIYLPASDRCPVILPKSDESLDKLEFKMKVLIMDDEFFVRDSLGMLFESMGSEVSLAENGDEAVSLYKEHLEKGDKFDLVFLDITVPLGKGAQYAIEKLRSIDPDVKAVVMSGYTDSDIMENYRSYGFVDILGKPYERKRIVEILSKLRGS